MPYIYRQNEWLRKNNLGVGSKVKVTRSARSYEDGWNNRWLTNCSNSMTQVLGGEFEIHKICENEGIQLNDEWLTTVPFFILEVV